VRTEDLVSLAKARGIDLSSFGGGTEPQGAAARRRRAQEESSVEAAPSRDRSRRPPQRSYAAPFEDLPWLAARYSFAGDESCYWRLWWGLAFQAQRIARRENWPPQVPGLLPRDSAGNPVRGARSAMQWYLLELAQLVLDEDANRPLFLAAPQLFALYMRVEPETWAGALEPRFRLLERCYQRWVGVARARIQRWMGEQEPQPIALLPDQLGRTVALIPATPPEERPPQLDEAALIAELSALLREKPQELTGAGR
jgi:hypothetical protein